MRPSTPQANETLVEKDQRQSLWFPEVGRTTQGENEGKENKKTKNCGSRNGAAEKPKREDKEV